MTLSINRGCPKLGLHSLHLDFHLSIAAADSKSHPSIPAAPTRIQWWSAERNDRFLPWIHRACIYKYPAKKLQALMTPLSADINNMGFKMDRHWISFAKPWNSGAMVAVRSFGNSRDATGELWEALVWGQVIFKGKEEIKNKRKKKNITKQKQPPTLLVFVFHRYLLLYWFTCWDIMVH